MPQTVQNETDYMYILPLILKELATSVNLILKQVFLEIYTKNHYRRMLCSAIASLNCDAKNFFLSFYSSSNYHEPYDNLIEKFFFYRDTYLYMHQRNQGFFNRNMVGFYYKATLIFQKK